MEQEKPIVLFDGHCNLCNNVVQFIIKHDPNAKILFSSLQGNHGQSLLRRHDLPTQDFDTFLLLKKGILYDRSTAFLEVCKELDGPINQIQVLRMIPKGFRDSLYSFVAKNRYSIFGKSETCLIPSPELKSRFL